MRENDEPEDDDRAEQIQRYFEDLERKRHQDGISNMRFVHLFSGVVITLWAGWGVWTNLDSSWSDLIMPLGAVAWGLSSLAAYGYSRWRGDRLTLATHSNLLKRWFVLTVVGVMVGTFIAGAIAFS